MHAAQGYLLRLVSRYHRSKLTTGENQISWMTIYSKRLANKFLYFPKTLKPDLFIHKHYGRVLEGSFCCTIMKTQQKSCLEQSMKRLMVLSVGIVRATGIIGRMILMNNLFRCKQIIPLITLQIND